MLGPTKTYGRLVLLSAAQIMALHQQIKPLEDEISFLQEANANNTRGDEVRAS